MTGRRTHGHSRSHGGKTSPTMISWLAMRQRCYYEKSKKYPRYGGRGITVCERWRDSFENFITDMGERPAGTTLDRKENDGNYEPGNCRWATSKTQAENCDKSLKGWKRENTHCVKGHLFDVENTRIRKDGSRSCRICTNENAKARRDRKMLDIVKSAVLSPCGKYRYLLRRVLKPDIPIENQKPLLFICLNPSTATATTDDPTIRRCITFARREYCTELSVVNLFAYRSTNPKELLRVPDPVGPENNDWLQTEIQRSRIVIAAWGANPLARPRAMEVIKKYGPFQCLGKTKTGSPCHPLYLKSDVALQDFPGDRE